MSEALPRDDAGDDVHRRFIADACRKRFHTAVDAVFTSEAYGPGFASALTDAFREVDPAHPPVCHVAVDPARTTIPISGSRIREDVHAHRRWLSPVVYASFVQRVCVLGGESSGKSTLAAALALRFNTVWVPEYGRELWLRKEGELEYSDLLYIGRQQVALEDAASERALRFLFCDTSPLTTAFYSEDLFGRVDPELVKLAKRGYALNVLAAPDFPFVQDGTRRDDRFRQRQHEFYRGTLERQGVAYVIATGSIGERLDAVAHALNTVAQSGGPA